VWYVRVYTDMIVSGVGRISRVFSATPLFGERLKEHQNGDIASAERVYRAILEFGPELPNPESNSRIRGRDIKEPGRAVYIQRG